MNDFFTTPNFGKPPEEYNQKYFAQLVQSLNVVLGAMRQPGAVQATNIITSDLPTTTTGLRTGELWNNSGVINIV